jgi:hypothetical protein
MRASSAQAVPRRWGDRGDSNPLIPGSTTRCIDHFCFGQRRRPGNRTPSRLCVGQLLAIELDAVGGSSRIRTRTVQIKSLVPVRSGATSVESCEVELNHRSSVYQTDALDLTWPPQGGGSTRNRTESSSASRSRVCHLHLRPMELRGRLERPPLGYKARALPVELTQRGPAGGNRTRSTWLEAKGAAVTPQRDGVVDRARTGDLHLGKVTRYQLRYYDVETPVVIETTLDALCRRTAAHMPTGSGWLRCPCS